METITTGRQNMEKCISHFTKAINDNKSDTGTLKAMGIANMVKEQVDQNKERQRILAQATVKANDKINYLKTNSTPVCYTHGKTSTTTTITRHNYSNNQSTE